MSGWWHSIHETRACPTVTLKDRLARESAINVSADVRCAISAIAPSSSAGMWRCRGGKDAQPTAKTAITTDARIPQIHKWVPCGVVVFLFKWTARDSSTLYFKSRRSIDLQYKTFV
jgi:post-segregation antitoxin (ccd killing protein)